VRKSAARLAINLFPKVAISFLRPYVESLDDRALARWKPLEDVILPFDIMLGVWLPRDSSRTALAGSRGTEAHSSERLYVMVKHEVRKWLNNSY
jgi:hypothetical protein